MVRLHAEDRDFLTGIPAKEYSRVATLAHKDASLMIAGDSRTAARHYLSYVPSDPALARLYKREFEGRLNLERTNMAPALLSIFEQMVDIVQSLGGTVQTTEVVETMPYPEELVEMYPEVDVFAHRMRRELWNNRHKGNQDSWRQMSIREAWNEIAWHHGKLTIALKGDDVDKARELLADIANGAMMMDDVISNEEIKLDEELS